MATVGQDTPRNAERRYYGLAALVAALVIFAAFSRTYYLKQAFDAPSSPASCTCMAW